MIVQEILSKKDPEVLHITPDDTVYDAISKMADHNIGALLVLEGETLVGIISERDYRNKVILKGRASKTTQVKEIMTEQVVWVTPDQTVDHCMAIMTQRKIRHLPVLNDENLVVGVISIGDLVKTIIDKQKVEISDLKHYITGSYPH